VLVHESRVLRVEDRDLGAQIKRKLAAICNRRLESSAVWKQPFLDALKKNFVDDDEKSGNSKLNL
jgi:hypothetical protein